MPAYKINIIRFFFVCICFLFSAASLAVPPINEYGALPEIQLITVSPSGNLIAFRKVTSSYDRVMVISMESQKAVRIIDVSSLQPDNMFFINETQLIFVGSNIRKIEGYKDKIDMSSAFLVDVTSGAIRQLILPGEGDIYRGQSGLGTVLGISPDGTYVYMPAFVGKDTETSAPDYSLLKVNVKEKRSPSVHSKGTKDTKDFFLDANGNIIAQESYNNLNNVHKIRVRKNDEWVDIFKETTEILQKSFVGLTPDYKSLVFLETNRDTGRTAYYTMSLEDGSVSQPIFGRDDADIEAVINSFQRIVYGVRYSGFTPSYQFFDAKLDARMKSIIAQFPDQSVHLVDFTPDWKNFVVFVEGSNASGNYYLVPDSNLPQILAHSRPNIAEADIQPIGRVTFTSRDGLKIPTLLTIPKESVGNIKNLPAIILPHGGPASHDTIEFNWMAQAFASRGYLVIQPQFRGSDGFGLKHELAGHGEWGKKMQDDLTDALNFTVKKGMVDPQRVCIVGASYGGYAALAGGAFTPDLYKCVVSIAGISDLKTMLAWDKNQNGKESWIVTYMQEQFTNGEADKEAMAAASPIHFAEKFSAPVLLIHGVDDQRVPFSESKQMKNALKDAKKEVTLVELKGEDHHLSKGPTRQQTLEETIKFVDAKIGKK